MFTDSDAAPMRRALVLARRGLGCVEPNPMVGAVLTHAGKIVAEGYHHRFGGAHAEVVALRAAGAKARGATLYVTLEPCCHWGKTPPCTDALLAAGVARVVVALVDPFAQVRGKGIARLRRAGIRVDVGLLEPEARALNAAFLTRVIQHRPFVIAKWAQSLDGCIATARGESQWISGEISRAVVQKLRGRVDGILVGIHTALRDDPLLLARPNTGRDIKRIATRIVLDSQCRLPLEGQLVRTVAVAPVLVVHAPKLTRAAANRRRALEQRGVMLTAVRRQPGAAGPGGGGLDVGALLQHLHALEYANILVEGGGRVLGSFFRAGLVDEAHVFVAPMVLGDDHAHHAVGGIDISHLADAYRMAFAGVERTGPDVHVTLRRDGKKP